MPRRHRDLQQQVDEVDGGDPERQSHRGNRREKGPADEQHAVPGRLVAVDDEGEIRGGGDGVREHQADAEAEVGVEQTAASRDVAANRKRRGFRDVGQRDRPSFDVAGLVVCLEHHGHCAALDEEHQHRPTEQRDEEGDEEGAERDGMRHERVGDGGEDLAHAPLQQVREITAEEHGDEDGRADDRHRKQHLEGRLRCELDRDHRPVGRSEQSASFEQGLQVQFDVTITPVYPVVGRLL